MREAIIAAFVFVCPVTAENASPWADAIVRHARGIDPFLVVALAREESLCSPAAIHPKSGATGILQLLPRYFAGNLKDPATNIRLGMKHLRWRLRRCRTVAGAISAWGGYGDCRPSVFSARVLRRLKSIQQLRRST